MVTKLSLPLGCALGAACLVGCGQSADGGRSDPVMTGAAGGATTSAAGVGATTGPATTSAATSTTGVATSVGAGGASSGATTAGTGGTGGAAGNGAGGAADDAGAVDAAGPVDAFVPGDAGPTLGGGNPGSMGLDRHDALYCGEWQKSTKPGDTIYLIKGGKVAWTHSLTTSGQDEFGDCRMLSNGHVVYNLKAHGAQEIVPDLQSGKEGPIVWRYDEEAGTEVHAVQPIGLDKMLVMQNGTTPKLMLIDKTAAAVCKAGMSCVTKTWLPESHGGVHGMFRHVRMLANGNLLVPYTSGGKVVEYTQDWQVVWEYPVGGSAWQAVRLHNGNTLISGNSGGWVREVNPAKQVVWSFEKADAPFPIYVTQGAMRLANGNTIINNWCGPVASTADWPKTIQVFEVTPAKQVVWKVQQWMDPNLGPGSSTQLLDEPGIPEKPGDLMY
jgi:hypothetical protein